MSEVTENESGRAAVDYMRDLGTRARAASKPMAAARRAPKDKALAVLSRLLLERSEEIQAVNREDLEAAKLKGYPDAFIDRLTVTEDTVKKMGGRLRSGREASGSHRRYSVARTPALRHSGWPHARAAWRDRDHL